MFNWEWGGGGGLRGHMPMERPFAREYTTTMHIQAKTTLAWKNGHVSADMLI